MNSDIRVRAFAKINLSLRVLGTRADGYHELRTIFQSIALYDTLVVRRTRAPLAMTCSDPSLACDRTNLVWQAAEALWTRARRRGSPRGVAIHLVKRIPIQAGLGGGSSDAASALRVLARLWRADERCVRETAEGVGADVPFFLEGGTVLGLDRGDVLFPLIDRPPAWVALVVPPFGVRTSDAYQWWDRYTPDTPQMRLRYPPDTPQIRFRYAPDTPQMGFRCGGNDLQAPVAARHPEIDRIVRALTRLGAECAAMSGSGSAVFGLFPTKGAAERAATALGSRHGRTLVTRTLTRAAHRRLAGN
jgi:4-diphosphocytidyl-2-C-methyl-D-erythritol kinase